MPIEKRAEILIAELKVNPPELTFALFIDRKRVISERCTHDNNDYKMIAGVYAVLMKARGIESNNYTITNGQGIEGPNRERLPYTNVPWEQVVAFRETLENKLKEQTNLPN